MSLGETDLRERWTAVTYCCLRSGGGLVCRGAQARGGERTCFPSETLPSECSPPSTLRGTVGSRAVARETTPRVDKEAALRRALAELQTKGVLSSKSSRPVEGHASLPEIIGTLEGSARSSSPPRVPWRFCY